MEERMPEAIETEKKGSPKTSRFTKTFLFFIIGGFLVAGFWPSAADTGNFIFGAVVTAFIILLIIVLSRLQGDVESGDEPAQFDNNDLEDQCCQQLEQDINSQRRDHPMYSHLPENKYFGIDDP